MTATVLQILRGARKLLVQPEAWTQGTECRDANGCAVGVHADADDIASRCLGRALYEAANRDFSASNAASVALGLHDVPAWNDSPRRTHAQVLRRLDRAIKRAEKEAEHD